jgi:hypothetical protein
MDDPPRAHLRTARELPRFLEEIVAEAPLPAAVPAAAAVIVAAAHGGQRAIRRGRLVSRGARTAHDRWRR